jgi:chorismate mutase/prephenate dehydratase
MVQPEKSGTVDVPAQTQLDRLREQIDAIDRAILDQLNARARLVQSVGRLKRDRSAAVYEPGRELRIVARLCAANPGPFPDAGLAPVFREIISATRSLEDAVTVAYFGPEGTFTHQAALAKFGELARLESAPSIGDVFAAVETGRVALGVVPAENTTEGVVTRTLDALAEYDVTLCAEVVLRISETLLSQSGVLADVRRVASHPQPLAQCRQWLDRNLPGVERVETASIAAAARLAAEDSSVAAIGSAAAEAVYGLVAIAESIEDRRDNSTRFIVIGREAPERSGSDLTSAVFTIRKDQPGGLHQLIEPMARRGVNLTAIHLRPIKGKPWEYLFFIELEGHREDPEVAAALEEAGRVAHSARILGSFPREGG